jgi:murein DD-endopeptidase / murein LD-carboxypeptidase
LDCVGVAITVFRVPADRVPRKYRMRGNSWLDLRAGLGEFFRRVPPAELRAGDLMVMRVSDDQLHLAVRTSLGFVHAHAGVRRVVETPGSPEWALLGAYRRRRR